MIWLLLFFAADSIDNGYKPAKPMTVTVVQNLSINEEGDEEFTGGSRVTGHPNGNIYVMNKGEFIVSIFDKSGKFIKDFSGKGQGPGETQNPTAITVDNQGRVVLVDSGQKKICFFDTDGKHLKDVKIDAGIQGAGRPAFMSDGTMVLAAVRTDGNRQMSRTLMLYDADAKPVKELIGFKLPPRNWRKMQEPGFWEGFLEDQFRGYEMGNPFGTVVSGDRIVAIRSNKYQGQILNKKGEEIGTFSKKLKRKYFDDKAKYAFFKDQWMGLTTNGFLGPNLTKGVFEKAYRKIEDMELLNPLEAMTPLGDGFAFVTNYDTLAMTGELEIFDNTGNLIAITDWKGSVTSLTGVGNNIYTMGENDKGNLVAYRYTVKGL